MRHGYTVPVLWLSGRQIWGVSGEQAMQLPRQLDTGVSPATPRSKKERNIIANLDWNI